MRKVTVYSTKGKSNAEITTDVTTWGELKVLLTGEGYDLESLNATENINRTDLINTEAALPEGEFTVFLRPKQTKSGYITEGEDEESVSLLTASFSELRGVIRTLDVEDKEDYISYLAGEGLHNYTHLSTEVLRSTLIDWLSLEAEEEAVQQVVEDCTYNTVEVLNTVLSTLNCIATTQDNEEINERTRCIFDEIVGIQNAIDEEKVLKLVALDAEALEILKGYNA